MKKRAMFFLILVGAFGISGCAVVEDGQAGVKLSWGKISPEPMNSGMNIINPLTDQVEIWNVKTQEIKETAKVPSSEGLISELDVSVLFQTPKDTVILLRKTIGSNYQSTVLEPYIRESIRNIVSGYQVKSLYSDEGRKVIGEKIKAFLEGKLGDKGVVIQDVLLRDVRLPSAFADSIQNKLKLEQEALGKEFQLQSAKKDAEIAVAKALGVADSNKVIANSITPNYLRYLWIQGMQTNQMQVVYVPTEANLPIMEAGKRGNWGDDEKPGK